MVQPDVIFFENQLFQHQQAVGRIADSAVVDTVDRIFRAALVITASLLDASFDEHRHQRIGVVRIVPTAVQRFLQIVDLPAEFRRKTAVDRFEIVRFERNVLIEVQCAEQRLHHVARRIDERGLARNDRFPATVVGKLAGFFERIAELHQPVDHGILVVHRNDPATETLHLGNPTEQFLGRMVADTHGDRIIADMQLFDDIQDEVGNRIGHFVPVLVDPAEDNVLIELGIPRTVEFADPLGSFDPKMGDQFAGFVQRDLPFLQVGLQIRPQHLVETPDPRPVAHQPVKSVQRP